MTFPRITVVTPSYNQAAFLEQTLRSVLDQNYPNLEYIVIDGGSTDGSVEIIQRYAHQLAYWISEPDSGQYGAINKGFARATGEIMAWINSDDLLMPWSLSVVGEIFQQFSEIQWLSSLFPLVLDGQGRVVNSGYREGFNRPGFLRGQYLQGCGWHAEDFIQQESTFWRKKLWDKAGGIDAKFQLAGDFDLWARFFKIADLYGVMTPLGAFRMHADQKTALRLPAYYSEAEESLRGNGGHPYGRAIAWLRFRLGSRLPGRLQRLLRLRPAFYVCVNDARTGKWSVASR